MRGLDRGFAVFLLALAVVSASPARSADAPATWNVETLMQQLSEVKQSQARFVESIRATLGGDIKALERFYRVELEGSAAKWQLFLVPRDRKMNEVISLIRIDGSQARLDTIEVQEARGDRSVMKITGDTP